MEKKTLTHCMLEMDSMMDAIESCNHMKIQQLFENELVTCQTKQVRSAEHNFKY
jgi:hypothetical protein